LAGGWRQVDPLTTLALRQKRQRSAQDKEDMRMTTRMLRTFVVSGFLGLSLSNAALAQTGCVPGVWTEVPGGGISTGTAPAAYSSGSDLYLFVTGGADLIYMNVFHKSDNSWTGWSEVPGNFRTGGTGPTVNAIPRSNLLHLFALDPTGHIFFNAFSFLTQSWSGWNEVPGDRIGTDGLGATWFVDSFFDPGHTQTFALDLFVRSTDSEIWENILGSNGIWGGWSRVPGGMITTHGPGVANAPAGPVGRLDSVRVTLYARGTDAAVYENVRDTTSGNWSGWFGRGGVITAAPGASNLLLGDLALVARGSGGGIFQIESENLQNPNSMLQWREVPGELHDTATAGPAVAQDPLNSLLGPLHFLLFVSGRGDHILCTAIQL